MSLIGTWRDAWENYSNNAGDAAGELTSQVGAHICKLYRKYPNNWAISPFSRGFLNSVCPPLGENPPPLIPPQFQGGQCAGVLYRLYLRKTTINTTTCNIVNNNFEFTRDVTGPVGNWYFLTTQNFSANCPTPGTPLSFNDVWIPTGTGLVKLDTNVVRIRSSGAVYGNWELYDIQRVDGLPDNCGSLPPQIPPNEPYDPGDLAPTFNINVYNENQTIINNQDFQANFNPNFEFEFPINFELNNHEFNFNFEGLDGSDNPDGDNYTTNVYNDRRTFRNDYYDEEDQPPSDPPNADPEGGSESEELESDLIEYVLFTITTLPTNSKVIVQKDAGDNDYFAGYFSWILYHNGARFYSEQIPIRKKRQYAKAPPESQGYRFWAVNGAKIKATTFSVKQN